MKLRWLLMVIPLVAGCGISAADDATSAARAPQAMTPELAEHYRLMAEQAKFRERFLSQLPSMKVERIYYIDPRADRETVPATRLAQGYVVASEAEGPAVQALAAALTDSVRKIVESAPEFAAACFHPHQMVTLSAGEARFDAVVCFDCGNYRIHSPDGEWLLSGSFDVAEEAVWDRAFSAAGIKRPAAHASR